MPGVQAFLAELPREIGSTVVNHGREADAAGLIIEQDYAQHCQFIAYFGQFLVRLGDLVLQLIATLPARPIQAAFLAIQSVLFRRESLGDALAIQDVFYDSCDQRQHFVDGFEAKGHFERFRDARCPISFGTLHGFPRDGVTSEAGVVDFPLTTSYVGFQVGVSGEKEVFNPLRQFAFAHPRVSGRFRQRPNLANLEKSSVRQVIPFANSALREENR